MATVGDVPRPRKRASQDETTPFLLEFVVVPKPNEGSRGRRIQDETAPFPLMLQALRRRKKRARQDETSPFLLAVAGATASDIEAASDIGTAPDIEAASDIAAAPSERGGRHGAPSGTLSAPALPLLTLPSLTLRGLNASSELREYAARIASGEDLPPYSGPILASEPPSSSVAGGASSVGGAERAPRSARSAPAGSESTASLRPVSPTSPAKVVLGLMLMLAALVASATAGDDATLRAAGQSVSGWLSDGTPPSYEPAGAVSPAGAVPPAPASAPQAPCAATAPAPSR